MDTLYVTVTQFNKMQTTYSMSMIQGSTSNVSQFTANETDFACWTIAESIQTPPSENILPISLLVIGLIFNVAFLYVRLQIPYMATVTNCYLTNLCIADILFILSKLVAHMVQFNEGRHQEMLSCIILHITHLVLYTSMFTLSVLCTERHRAICKPFTAQRSNQQRRVAVLCLLTWFLGALFMNTTGIYCSTSNMFEERRTAAIVMLIAQIFPFIVCMSLMVVMYSRIYLSLKRQCKMAASLDVLEQSHAEMTQVTKLLVVTASVFFILVTPWHLYKIYEGLLLLNVITACSRTVSMLLVKLFRTLIYMNAAINPILYNITSATYRQAFKDAFLHKCLKPSRRLSSASINTNGTSRSLVVLNQSSNGVHSSKHTVKLANTVETTL